MGGKRKNVSISLSPCPALDSLFRLWDIPLMSEKSEQIAALNDALRTTFNPAAGRVVATQGIRALPESTQRKIVRLVQTFNAFSKDNNPYGERDYGQVQADGHKACFKFDYYDKDLKMHSPDAADPDKTIRVMTVMLTREW